MSQVKKIPKAKKLVSLDENQNVSKEPKKRASRAKPIKMLQDASNK